MHHPLWDPFHEVGDLPCSDLHGDSPLALNSVKAAAQERLEEHRRQEASRALVVSEREAVRSAVLAVIQQRLAGVKGLLPVLRTLQVPVEGEPTPTQAQILRCALSRPASAPGSKHHSPCHTKAPPGG